MLLSQIPLVLLALVFLVRGVSMEASSGEDVLRDPRRLAFPFNQNRQNRQSPSNEADFPLDIGTIAAAGDVCIDKVVTVEEVEYDNIIECKHSYSKRCHDTYKTDYSPQQEEECEENFKKNCFIEYKKRASKETIRFCITPLVKNCNVPGPEECTIEYKTQCTTRYHEHEVKDDVADCQDENEVKCEDVTQGYTTEQKCTSWPVKKCQLKKETVKKYTPETTCEKVPFNLCGPSSCPTEPGPEECINKDETFVEDKPEENCSLEPQRSCKLVTKLIPLLKAVENCIDIPKEICINQKRNPRKVKIPVIKKWCYTPKSPPLKPGVDVPDVPDNQGRGTPPPFRTTPPSTVCSTSCRRRRNDGVCNPECNTPLCNYDGNDCRTTTVTTTRRTTTRRTTTRRTTTQRTTTTTEPSIGYLPPYNG